MDNSKSITIKEISENKITKVYLCNFLSKGKLFFSLNEDINVLRYNLGENLTAKSFDSYIEAKFKDKKLVALVLVDIESKKPLYTIDGQVLEHFLKLPVFEYKVLLEQKNKKQDKSTNKRLVANLYKYVVSKAVEGSI